MNSTSNSNDTLYEYFESSKLLCSSCHEKLCSNEFYTFLKIYTIEKLSNIFLGCFCNDVSNARCYESYDPSTEICISNYGGLPIPDKQILPQICALNPIPPEIISLYERKLTSNKTPEVAIVENNLDPRPFIIPFLFTFFVLAIVKKKWSEDTTTEQNFNTTAVPSNNAIPLNERSLYYYQEEFGDEQLPKYTKDASDFNYEPSREDISLQVLNSDTTTNTTTVAGPPTFEESQVSTGQNIEQGETLNEIQQSGNTESIENAETTISIPTTTNEQTVNSI